MTAYSPAFDWEFASGVWRARVRQLLKKAKALLAVGNGGIIGPRNAPTSGVAPGVWRVEEQQVHKAAGNWPTVGSLSRRHG